MVVFITTRVGGWLRLSCDRFALNWLNLDLKNADDRLSRSPADLLLTLVVTELNSSSSMSSRRTGSSCNDGVFNTEDESDEGSCWFPNRKTCQITLIGPSPRTTHYRSSSPLSLGRDFLPPHSTLSLFPSVIIIYFTSNNPSSKCSLERLLSNWRRRSVEKVSCSISDGKESHWSATGLVVMNTHTNNILSR